MAEINAAYAGSPNIVSMQQDLLHRRVTEINYLNGAVAALGETHGVNCPTNDALTRIIKGMEDTSRSIESVNSRETLAKRS
jgi:ketopantoate reductase